MDIIENGIAAGADLIRVDVNEQKAKDRLEIKVTDNGKGIPKEMVDKVVDPFYTSRTTRRVGLGLSLFKAAAERCDGTFQLTSSPGQGTAVVATFRYGHIDRAPLGDMAESMGVLIVGNPEIDFIYTHVIGNKRFCLDTREVGGENQSSYLRGPMGYMHWVRSIRDALNSLYEDK